MIPQPRSKLTSVAAVGLLGLSCSSTRLNDVGDLNKPVTSDPDAGMTHTSSNDTAGVAIALPDAGASPESSTDIDWGAATTNDGTLDFEPTEIWRGYVVEPRWPLPENDLVVLYVEARTDTQITGAIVFGEGELPEPATDPDVGYLPPFLYADQNYTGEEGGSWDNLRGPHVWPGYALSLVRGTISTKRVQFEAYSTEQWKTWCEMQVGYKHPESRDQYQCIPDGNDGTSYDCSGPNGECTEICDIDGVPLDCIKYALCIGHIGPVCACDGEGTPCTSSQDPVALVDFDLRLEADNTELNGVVLPEGRDPSFNVYLTREK